MNENEELPNSLKNKRNKKRLKKIINDKNILSFSISNCLNKKRDKRKIVVIKNCNNPKKDSDIVSTINTSYYFDKDSFNKINDLQNIFNIEEEEKNNLIERIYDRYINNNKINDKNDRNQIINNIENKIILLYDNKKGENKNYSNEHSNENRIIIKEKKTEMNIKIFKIKNQKKHNELYLINKKATKKIKNKENRTNKNVLDKNKITNSSENSIINKKQNKNSPNVSNINNMNNKKIDKNNMNNENNNNLYIF